MFPKRTLEAFAASLPESRERRLFEEALRKAQATMHGKVEVIFSGTLHTALKDTPAESLWDELGQNWLNFTDIEDIKALNGQESDVQRTATGTEFSTSDPAIAQSLFMTDTMKPNLEFLLKMRCEGGKLSVNDEFVLCHDLALQNLEKAGLVECYDSSIRITSKGTSFLALIDTLPARPPAK